MISRLAPSLLTLVVASVACAQHDTKDARPTKDIVAVAAEVGSFSTLLAAAKAAGLVDALRGEGPLTVFAPTDEAFAKLGKKTIDSLLEPKNKAKLVNILSYHVVSGELAAAKVVASKKITTLRGEELTVDTKSGVKVGGATVVKTDVWAKNGVIHVIDGVMLPPERQDIVGTAVAAGTFGTLAKALTAAGLVDALKGEGPFTVFAPTDAAFAKLDPATLASLLEPANKDKLVSILKFHVVSGRVLARDVVKMTTAETLQGDSVTVAVSDKGSVKVGGANVVATNVLASNGVIHVIDAVIMPPSND